VLLVFDQRQPLDLADLRGDPVFESATVQLLPGGTLIRLQPPAGMMITAAPAPNGWRIAVLATATAPQPIVPVLAGGQLSSTLAIRQRCKVRRR
jgi:hypothetical protein